ncbi:GNAT family N-acetyltransferase [Streptomyces sp. NPDC000229]|uniref:GNAT family N-acetyltransferase n=1 Tax=Streptomyces sp. NPDC000229 TaxID=3154247 RepID=UPI003328CA73
MVVTVSPVLDVTLRPYTPADEAAVLELIDADRLPGQPHATPAMLRQALQGRSPVDAGWWAELDTPTTQVAMDSTGAVVGAVSYAARPKDGMGQLLWLHCQERPDVADALIHHTVTALAPRPVHAFHFASALSLGLEALPVRHRPATAAALDRAGFTGERLWRYMRADLPAYGLPRLTGVKVMQDPGGKDARRLEARKGRRTVAEAVVGLPVQGTGVLWWIGVLPDVRGQGLGRAMLGSALDVLAGLGATQAILYVDDDAPPGDERDRTAAISLYESAGFSEVDRLYSYTLSASP